MRSIAHQRADLHEEVVVGFVVAAPVVVVNVLLQTVVVHEEVVRSGSKARLMQARAC